MIRIEKISKDYNPGGVVVHALRDISLDIKQGEFVSIAGPSGSGKTSLLNLIGCIDKATSGDIYIEGEPVSGKRKKELALLRRKKIGFVFQSFNLIPVLTAYENVSLALSLLGGDKKQIRERSMAILNEVGLNGMEKRLPSELSGGQQQRIAIARALVKRPQIVLADEPTANLDSKTGQDILNLMEELNDKYKTTYVFSTHDKMVMDFGHRLVMLYDGEIASDKTIGNRGS